MNMLLGIFGHAVLVVLHLGICLLDLTLLLLLARFLVTSWPAPLLQKLDTVGRPLLDPLMAATQRVGRVSYRSCFLVLSVGLSVCRLALVAVAHSLIATY